MGGEALGNHWDHPHQGLFSEMDGPMGGQDGAQGPIRARQWSDLPGLGLAMIENHDDDPLGKEQESGGKTQLGLKYDIARSRKPLT